MVRYGQLGVLRYGPKYDITFGRYDWSGVMAACTVFSRDALVWFLLEKVKVTPHAFEELLTKIDTDGSGHLDNIPLTDESRLRYGMVAPAEGICAA